MIVFRDIVTGDEVLSDSFFKPNTAEVDGFFYKVQTRLISDNDNVECDTGANPSAEEEVEQQQQSSTEATVIDLVKHFRLQPSGFAKKKDYVGYLKDYVKRVKELLQQEDEEKAERFQKAGNLAVKNILQRGFDNFTFYTGESMNPEGLCIISDYEDDAVAPVFYFIKDGLKEEKC